MLILFIPLKKKRWLGKNSLGVKIENENI